MLSFLVFTAYGPAGICFAVVSQPVRHARPENHTFDYVMRLLSSKRELNDGNLRVRAVGGLPGKEDEDDNWAVQRLISGRILDEELSIGTRKREKSLKMFSSVPSLK